jgi:hypothetical protein
MVRRVAFIEFAYSVVPPFFGWNDWFDGGRRKPGGSPGVLSITMLWIFSGLPQMPCPAND